MRGSVFTLLIALLMCNLGFAQTNVIDAELQEVLNEKGSEKVSVNIIFKAQKETAELGAAAAKHSDKEAKRAFVIDELKTYSAENQQDVMSILQAEKSANRVSDITAHWVVNMINCTASADVIYRLAEHPDISLIVYNKKEKMIGDTKTENMGTASNTGNMTENITKVNADDVWDAGYTGEGVIVAVLDTGINYNHVDLANNMWDGGSAYPHHGYDFINGDNDPMDDEGHGTHCAGTICGDGTSGLKTGMAPGATLMCVKVLDGDGSGSLDVILDGVEFALDNGAHVLSLSLGFGYPSSSESEIMRNTFVNVLNAGVVASVAAGNDRDDIHLYPIPNNVGSPGNCPPPWLHPDQQANAGGLSAVISVGAVDYNDAPAYFSSEGPVTFQETSYGDYPFLPINIDDGWLYYDNNVCVDGIGGPPSFYWGIKFPASIMSGYEGKYLTKVSMYDNAATSGGQILIYQGGENAPGTLIHEQDYSGTGSRSFVEYSLSSAIPIDETQSMWVVMSTEMGAAYPASVCANTGNPNGRWISTDGSTWNDVVDLGFPYTWMIRAFLADEAKGNISGLKPITIDYISSEGTFSAKENNIATNHQRSSTDFGLIRPDVSAPGVGIVSCDYSGNNGHVPLSGTSMATPCNAGVIALMLDKNPDLTPADICRILETTAVPLSETKSNRTGSGRIDALAAINEVTLSNSPHLHFVSVNPETITTNEDTELNVTVANIGGVATIGNTNLTLSSDDTYVTIVDGEGNVGVLEPEEEATSSFVVNVDPSTPDMHVIDFNLHTESEDNYLTNLTYGFEDGMEGWTTIDADGDGFDWTYNNQPNVVTHEGIGSMFSCSYYDYALTPDNYLVSPEQFEISESTTLKFWACAQDADYAAEHFGVAISTTGNSSGSDFTTIAEWTMTAKSSGNHGGQRGDASRVLGTWYQYTVDLSEYEGQDIWIAIRHFNCTDQFYLVVDDVAISNCMAPLSKILNFSVTYNKLEPMIAIDSHNPEVITANEDTELNVTIKNIGDVATIGNTNLTLTSNDTYVTIVDGEGNVGVLEPEEEATSSFVVNVDPSTPDMHVIDFNLHTESEDNYLTNLTYGFENGFEGWTSIDADGDGNNWIHSNQTNIPKHEGIGSVYSHSYISSALTPDNYLVSPFKIGVLDNTEFSFWACAQNTYYAAEHFGVAISTAGNCSGSDFTTIDEWTIGESKGQSNEQKPKTRGNSGLRGTAWTQYTVDLSEYEGQDIWIAIRHFNCTDQFILCVDDVTITNCMAPSYTWNDSFSITVSNPLETPEGLEGELLEDNTVSLSWTAVEYINEYHIYRNGSFYATSTENSFVDSNVYPEKAYCYTVCAVRGADVSEHSDYVCIETEEDFYVIPPVAVEANELDESSVEISWDWNEITSFTEDFETGDFNANEWNNTYAYPWIITEESYEGTYAMMSSNAGVNNSSSVIEIDVDVTYDGIMSFYHKISSESNYDKGYFYIDGDEKPKVSGEHDWNYVEFPITAGNHTFRWVYKKDSSVNSGSDTYYVDNITFFQKPSPYEGEWIYYDDGVYQTNVGTGSPSPLYWGVSFPNSIEYYGYELTKVAIYDAYEANYTANIYIGGGNAPQTLVASQEFTTTGSGSLIEVELDTPVGINSHLPLWITFYCDELDHPASACNHVGNSNSDWISFDGASWNHVGNHGAHVSWMIRGFLEDGEGEATMLTNSNIEFVGGKSEGTIVASAVSTPKEIGTPETRSVPAFRHYNVYRSACDTEAPVLLASNVTETTYIDNTWDDAEEGLYKWGVSVINKDNIGGDDISITWSDDCIQKIQYYTETTVNVETDDDEDATGAVVSFVNKTEPEMGYDYEVTLDETGTFTWEKFRKGTYELTISLPGYISDYVNEEVVIEDVTVINSMLQKILPPANLAATAVNEYTVNLSWNAALGAESYNVYRGTELVGNVTETAFVDEDLTPFTAYCYTVTSVAGEVETEHSAEACVTTPDLPCITPTGLTAEALSHTSVELSWTAAPNAMSYNIYRDGELIENITTTSYTDDGLEAETEYCYAVSTVRNESESELTTQVCVTTPEVMFTAVTVNVETDSDDEVTGAVVSFVNKTEPEMGYDYEVTLDETGTFTWDEFRFGTYELTIALAGYISDFVNEEVVVNDTMIINSMLQKILPPANLAATAVNEYTVNLSWNAALGADSYNVYRGTELVGNVTETAFVDEDLTPFTAYCYTVTSVAGEVETEHSAEACVTTPDLPCITPTGLTAEALSHASVELSWTAAPNAMSYNIYRDGELIENITTTSYTDDGLEAETEYCYAISSVRNESESGATALVCVTTLEEPMTSVTVNVETDSGDDATGAVVSFVNKTEPEMGYDYEVTLDETGTFTWEEFRIGTYELTIALAGYVSDYVNEEVVVEDETVINSMLQKILPPANLAATAVNEYTVNLSWNAALGADSYNVYRGTELVGNVTETAFVDEDLTPFTAYCYTVTSVAGEVETEHSAEVCVTTPDLPCITPTGLTAEALSHTSVELSWTAAPNAMSYNIYRDGELIENVTTTSYIDEELEAETEYCYAISSVRNESESEATALVCVTTLEEPMTSVTVNVETDSGDDATGAVVSFVNMTEPEMGFDYEVTLDETGTFTWEEFRIGTYELTISLPGYVSDYVDEEVVIEDVTVINSMLQRILPPANLTATAVDEYTVLLSWDAALGAESYNVYRGTELIGYTIETSFVDYGASPYTSYCYTVTSEAGEVETEHSAEACVTTPDLPCITPTGLTADALSHSSIGLSWTAAPNAMSYNIYRDGELIENVTTTSYTDEELLASTEYCYAVSSVRNDNESGLSNVVCATTEPLSVPTNLTAIPVSDSKIYLNWDDNPDATSYNVYRDGELIVNVNTSVYMDNGLNFYREYCYTVTTVSNEQESEHSEMVCATTTDYPSVPPTNLVAETIDEYSIALTWEEAAHAMSYNIYRDEELIASTDDLDFIDDDLEPDTRYCYYVTSVRNDVESDYSNRACATTDEIILPCLPPTNLQAEVEQDLPDYEYMFKVTLTWDGVDNANRYTVYVDGEEVGSTFSTSFVYGTDEEGTIEFTVTSQCAHGESDHSEPLEVLIQNDAIAEYENMFVLYPNPADDKLIIDTEENIHEVIITNLLGIMLYQESEYVNKEINLSNFSSGTYFISIRTDKGEVIKRFIKK